MDHLAHTRRVLREYLSGELSRVDIQTLFVASGFQPLADPSWRRSSIINQFYAQRDWSQLSSADVLFGVAYQILKDLKERCAANVAGGTAYRQQFRRILLEGLRRDGADFFLERGIVTWADIPKGKRSVSRTQPAKGVDLLFVTALLEEHQVVTAVLRRLCQSTGDFDGDLSEYRYTVRTGGTLRIVATSAYRLGGTALGVFAASILKDIRPGRAVLFGIAAAVDTDAVELGDVPFSSQVLSMDNIAVQNGLEFRPEGFQTDPEVQRWIGHLQTSAKLYERWQTACVDTIEKAVPEINRLRRTKIAIPEVVSPPHIQVGNMAGGPFLLRDADFRDSLKDHSREFADVAVRVKTPVHPQLLSAEMESHGFMRATHEAGIPASVVKGVSDLGSSDKSRVEKETGGFYRAYACSNAVLALLHCLRTG